MDKPNGLLGFYNYTVVLTYIGMITGFIGIVLSLEGNGMAGVICLMIAGLCDMFDGTVASTKNDRTVPEKNFGIQIDSLSDLICFGVLPASIGYGLNHHKAALVISALYVLCALIRLAYFNVDEAERQKKSAGSREIYFGMPVTLSALIVPLVYAVVCLKAAKTYIAITIVQVLMGALFLIPIELKKPHMKGKICAVVIGIIEVVLVVLAGKGI